MWTVHETECWPKSFKVNRSRTDKYAGDNDSNNYFFTRIEAQLEADKRNAREILETSGVSEDR